MNFIKLVVGLLAVVELLPSGSPLADTRTKLREDGSTITYYVEAPATPKFPLIILFQGSPCVTSAPMFNQTKVPLVGSGIAVLAVEKPGLTDQSIGCPAEYLEKNTIQRRVLDTLIAIRDVERLYPQWNGNVAVAGDSEGGMVAALVAPLVHQLKGVLMLAAGGGLSMGEELLLLQKKRLEIQGATSDEVKIASDTMKLKFTEMEENPISTREYLSDGQYARNTYKWWASVLPTILTPSLEQVNAPIYIAHGTADTSSPVESSDLLVARLRETNRQLTYKRYEGLEHNWRDASGTQHPEVFQDALKWLIQTIQD